MATTATIPTLDDAADAVYADAFTAAVHQGLDVDTYIARQVGRATPAVDPRHRLDDPDEPFGYDDGGFPVYLPAQSQRMTA